MEQGDLGVVRLHGEAWPNPLGMSVTISDIEMAQQLNANPQLITYPPDTDDPAETQAYVETVTNLGRAYAVTKARVLLRLAGLDIADRPISVEPVIELPTATKWHVLAPIVIAAEQDLPRRLVDDRDQP